MKSKYLKKGLFNHTKRGIFGPTKSFWDEYANDFGRQYIKDNPDYDARTLGIDEIKEAFNINDSFDLGNKIPDLELPKNSWYTNTHIYIQQTDLDDIWRMGFTSLRWYQNRYIEWLEFDCEPNDLVLYSNSIMYYSVSDWKPINGLCNQSTTDIEYCCQLPFHRGKIIAVNERIRGDPSMLLNDNIDPNEKWICVFKWMNNYEEIFSKPPIIHGRYGEWFDEEQYIEHTKDNGEYKRWQIDQIQKLFEDKKLRWNSNAMKNDETYGKYQRPTLSERNDTTPKYLKLDDGYNKQNIINNGGNQQKIKKQWSKWWPFKRYTF